MSARRTHFITGLRATLFIGGLGLVCWLVRAAGVAQVLAVLRQTWRWMPLVAALEVAFVSMDVVSLRCLLGAASSSIPMIQWVRSTAVAYASTILLPAGRAAGEAGRAITLAPVLGAAYAAATCTRLQACALAGNTGISGVIVAMLWVGGVHSSGLLLLLLGNAAVCGGLAAGLLALLANGRFAGWLRARLHRFDRTEIAEQQAATSRQVGSAIAFSVIGRLVQSLQYGVVLHAVGGIATPTAVWATQGTHLVGAALGDLVPGQVGVTEAAYGVFATTLGLGGQPARALSIALMARIAQVALAVGCIFISFLSRPRAPVSSPQPGGD